MKTLKFGLGLIVMGLLAGCSSGIAFKDADIIYKNTQVIVTEENDFIDGKRKAEDMTPEEKLRKKNRNAEYMKYVTELRDESKAAEAGTQKEEEK